MIKKSLFLLVVMFACAPIMAQKKSPKTDTNITIAMKPGNWTAKDPGNLKFADHNGSPSMEITAGNETAVASNINFANGTIEFDMEFIEGFTSFYFHRQSDDETELFYLRNRPNDPTATDAIQYAPIIRKVNMWDMYPNYEAAASFKPGEWTHIKLVISGVQMLVYVNDKNPTLVIPRLEGNVKDGGIAFAGKCFVSNVVLKPNLVEGLNPMGEFDPVYNDNRYIKSWYVSSPVDLPEGREPTNIDLPAFETQWQKITAERNGLINVTRLFGQSTLRRMVWLRTTLKSKGEQKSKVNLGFSDEVWVFVNGRTAYADKNLYAQDMRKEPDGRISVENSSFEISLKDGDNDILVALANDFYGWGIIPRLEKRIGVEVADYVPEVPDKKLEKYFGSYSCKDLPFKLRISQLKGQLSIQATGEGQARMENTGPGVFELKDYNVLLQFKPAEKGMTFKQNGKVYEFVKD
ncbi:MAG TPA: hypothetical protein VF473_10990 [Cyclobacteriaceae bacterium]